MGRIRRPGAWMVACLVVAASARVHAAGFMLFEQSGRGLGTAFAGEAAVAEDASTIAYNPAGLGWVPGTQLVTAGFAILPSAEFDNEGSTLSPALGGGALRGGNGGDAGELGLVPTAFLAHELGNGFHVGVGLSAPFGLETRYNRGWVGRYHALSSSLVTINVNPTIAWRPVDWLAVGVGGSVQYAKARLTNDIDLGGVCEILGGEAGLPPGACAALGFTPQSTDANVQLEGDDWGGGYNVGLMLAPWRTTRIGLAFRSSVEHDIDGRATFAVPRRANVLRRASGALYDTGARVDVELPERASLAVYHELTKDVAVMGDVTWTRWSRFDELVFRFRNPRQPTIVQPEGWDDSFRYAVGLVWRASEAIETRFGFAWDESAIPDETLRTPRIPDSDRFWLSAGVAWSPTERIRFDVGYAHIFSPEVRIRNLDAVTGHVIRGTYSASADIVGVQLTYGLGWPLL